LHGFSLWDNGWKTGGFSPFVAGTLLENLQQFSDTFESYAMQRSWSEIAGKNSEIHRFQGSTPQFPR
jgi:hypothetical protein